LKCSCGRVLRPVRGYLLYGYSHPRRNDWFYRCGPCDSHVGCHKGTQVALGTPANGVVRRLRQDVHTQFDVFWSKAQPGSRSRAYETLAKAMGLDREACHIGMFDADQCRQALQVCRKWSRRNGRPGR